MKIGKTVIYTAELYDRTGVPGLIDYPAIVYKVDTWDTRTEIYILGLYVFTDDGLKLMRKVSSSKSGDQEKETWRNYAA